MRATVGRARTALARVPDSITFADNGPGLLPEDISPGLPTGVCTLLEITDGPRAGVLVVFRAALSDQQRFFCDDLAGGRSK